MSDRPPPYQPYRDIAPTPFRWRLGVRPLDLDHWIEIDEHYDDEIAQKHAVMASHPDTAFQVLDTIMDESIEIRDAVVEHLRALDPATFGSVAADADLHPLDAAARLVQEDLVVLVERDGTTVCGGGSVCFPNRWDLTSKLGRTMAAIHQPVAQLNDQLEDPIDKFLERLSPERSFWRLGWGIVDTDELYQAVDGTAPPRPVDPAPPDHFLRVERETLRRMPKTGCILFTIRTHLTPLSSVARHEGARALADAMGGLPDDVADYKQLDGIASDIAEWLRTASQT